MCAFGLVLLLSMVLKSIDVAARVGSSFRFTAEKYSTVQAHQVRPSSLLLTDTWTVPGLERSDG